MKESKRKNLKQLAKNIINYKTAKTNLREHYPNFSGSTQIEWNRTNQEYSIEVGSELSKKILGRSRVRFVPFDTDPINYNKVYSNILNFERITTHCFTFAPRQPTSTNNIDVPLSTQKLNFHMRSVFDYLVKHNQGTNVFMVIRLENDNYNEGYHIHATAIATTMDVSWRQQSQDIKQLTYDNFGSKYFDKNVTHYMVPFDYTYKQSINGTYYDYCHKAPEFEEQLPSINYILTK